MKTVKARDFNQGASSYARQVLETGEPVSIVFRGSNETVLLMKQSENHMDSLIAAGKVRQASGQRLGSANALISNPANVDLGQAVVDMRDEEDS